MNWRQIFDEVGEGVLGWVVLLGGLLLLAGFRSSGSATPSPVVTKPAPATGLARSTPISPVAPAPQPAWWANQPAPWGRGPELPDAGAAQQAAASREAARQVQLEFQRKVREIEAGRRAHQQEMFRSPAGSIGNPYSR